MTTNEQKRKQIETIAKVGGAGVVGFLVAPVVFIAIKGLIGLIIAAIVSFVAIQFIPVFALKVANWRLKAIKAEASENPVETLQNDYRIQQENLSRFLQSIKDFAAQVNIFGGKLDGFAKQYPDEAPKFRENHQKMKDLLALRFKKYEESKAGLAAYDLEIQKVKALWEMGLAAAEMNKAAGVDAEEFLQKISRETAIDSVQKLVHTALADLEISLAEERPSLEAPKEGIAIELETKNKVVA
jgi:hypothetical protein